MGARAGGQPHPTLRDEVSEAQELRSPLPCPRQSTWYWTGELVLLSAEVLVERDLPPDDGHAPPSPLR